MADVLSKAFALGGSRWPGAPEVVAWGGFRPLGSTTTDIQGIRLCYSGVDASLAVVDSGWSGGSASGELAGSRSLLARLGRSDLAAVEAVGRQTLSSTVLGRTVEVTLVEFSVPQLAHAQFSYGSTWVGVSVWNAPWDDRLAAELYRLPMQELQLLVLEGAG